MPGYNMPDDTKVYSWRKGDVVKTADVPDAIRHLFHSPQHYHWNYPAPGGGHQIMKDVTVTVSGNAVILSFDKL